MPAGPGLAAGGADMSATAQLRVHEHCPNRGVRRRSVVAKRAARCRRRPSGPAGLGAGGGSALHRRQQVRASPAQVRHGLHLPDARRARVLRDAAELQRIQSLVIPPAWTDVWICPDPRGHLQATGRDARGRKQYRYHPRWREVRDETKYDRLIAFAQALPAVRRRTDADLRATGCRGRRCWPRSCSCSRRRSSASATTSTRAHNRRSASRRCATGTSRSSGSTRPLHLPRQERRRARGRARRPAPRPDRQGVPRSARPGAVPVSSTTTASRQTIGSSDVNAYLHEITGEDFTSKDFRTWAGTVLAAQLLRDFEEVDSEAQAKKNIVRAVEQVAKRLGNTRAVCRKCYIHPAVIDAYLDGSMMKTVAQRARACGAGRGCADRRAEAAVLGLLQRRLARRRAAAPVSATQLAGSEPDLQVGRGSVSAADLDAAVGAFDLIAGRRRSAAPRACAASIPSSRAAGRRRRCRRW